MPTLSVFSLPIGVTCKNFTYWNILAVPQWGKLGFPPFSHPHLLRMILRVRYVTCISCDLLALSIM